MPATWSAVELDSVAASPLAGRTGTTHRIGETPDEFAALITGQTQRLITQHIGQVGGPRLVAKSKVPEAVDLAGMLRARAM